MAAPAPDKPEVDRDEDAVMTPSSSAQPPQAAPAAAAAPSAAPAPASPPRAAPQQTLHVVASPSKKSRAVDALAVDDMGTSGDDDDDDEPEAQLQPRARGPSLGGDEEMDDFRVTGGRRLDATRKPKARKQDGGKEGRLLDEDIRQRYIKEIGDIFAEPSVSK